MRAIVVLVLAASTASAAPGQGAPSPPPPIDVVRSPLLPAAPNRTCSAGYGYCTTIESAPLPRSDTGYCVKRDEWQYGCGACFLAPNVIRAHCTANGMVIDECLTGYLDADRSARNGCEASAASPVSRPSQLPRGLPDRQIATVAWTTDATFPAVTIELGAGLTTVRARTIGLQFELSGKGRLTDFASGGAGYVPRTSTTRTITVVFDLLNGDADLERQLDSCLATATAVALAGPGHTFRLSLMDRLSVGTGSTGTLTYRAATSSITVTDPQTRIACELVHAGS